MQYSLKQYGVIAGFALLGFLLFGNAVLTKYRLDVQSESTAWVLHSRQVLFQLEETESTLKDAETGQRGYLLTGDTKYLAPYDRAQAEIDSHIASLARLTADNPAQRKNIAELQSLAHEKMNELAQTVSLYQSGNVEQARALVLTDRGLLLMDDLRRAFSDMRLDEVRLDGERNAEYRRSIQLTTASIWLATTAALLGLIALAWFIVRERNLREKHARELRARVEWFRTTLTCIGDAVIATDQFGTVSFLNPVAEKLTGMAMKEASGKNIKQVFPIFNEISGNKIDDPVKKVMELGIVVGLANHTVLRNSNGTLIPIEDSAAPIRDGHGQLIGVVLVFRDVTAERKSQDVMRKTEKLAAAARLSATVAHEINNPLAAVVNLIFLAKNTPETPASVVQQLVQVEHELARVAHITRQTLAFYRESGAKEEIEVRDLIESVLNLYSNKLDSKNIKVERMFDDCPPILGVRGELRQAASNLIANAIDAVESNGTISVAAHSAEVGGERMIEVVFADNGPGIRAEDHDRIFEPFFTTKKDVGTGLGLWATKTIVERHGGTIAVRDLQDGDGARGVAFTVLLPSASPQTAPPARTGA